MKAHWACTIFRGLVNSYGITDTEMHIFFRYTTYGITIGPKASYRGEKLHACERNVLALR